MKSPSLADAPLGSRLRIAALDLDADAAAWLGAVGLHEGEEVTVLRRAAFGGPLHVRTGSGGEFAVARDVAEHVAVEPASDDRAAPSRAPRATATASTPEPT